MRMWMLPPKMMCRKHLLGEHGEIHKHRHNFIKRHSIAGRLSPIVQIEPNSMEVRHDELAAEMVRRGYNHNSPYTLPDLSYLPHEQVMAKVDVEQSRHDLRERCDECRKLFDTLDEKMYTESVTDAGAVFVLDRPALS